MADIMLDLVRNIVNIRYEDLPPEAVDYAKKSILDTIAVTIAGSTAEGCKAVVELVKGFGGKKESTVWVYGGRVPAPLAGLAIGPMARARDLGDVHENGGGHVTEYILPAAYPVAESLKNNGKDLITAVALAQDMMIRLALTINRDAGSLRMGMSRIFAPTAAVAKLAKLDEVTMLNAMGIAYTQAAGEWQGLIDGALTVRVEHGFVAEAAIKSVLLAQKGITGAKNILQGEKGFYNAFAPQPRLDRLTFELGKRFEGVNTSIKPYPCCKFAHAAIYATINLVQENDIRPQDVAQIDVGVGKWSYEIICEPEELKRNPQNIVDCQFSLPYTVAASIVNRRVFIQDFTPEAIARPDVRQIMGKVRMRIAPEATPPDNRFVGGAIVTIKTKGGKEHTKMVHYVKGHPKNPMTIDDMVEKFRACLPFSATPISGDRMNEIVRTVANLEQVDDVAVIARLLAP